MEAEVINYSELLIKLDEILNKHKDISQEEREVILEDLYKSWNDQGLL